MFTVVRTTTNLSLDEHFIKHPAGTFFVKVEGDGMVDHGILKGDTLIIDRSLNPEKNSIVVVAAKLPTKWDHLSGEQQLHWAWLRCRAIMAKIV